MVKRLDVVIAICSVVVMAGTASAGTVNSVSASPRTTVVGTEVTVVVAGTNPCGAAHVIYGDGTAITYAISALPTTQTHTYGKPGSYTVTARGMGNCDGEATTSVTVSGPAPQAPAGEITAVDMAPTPGLVRAPVTFTVRGTGTCAFEVQYGDGNSQDVNGGFPRELRHTYGLADRYTVIVKPVPPCVGRFTQLLQVVDPSTTQAGRILRLALSPTPGIAGQPVDISVEGSGACDGYTLDYGDGNLEPRTATLPDRVRHVYTAVGRYTVSAAAKAPCTGTARTAIEVRTQSAPVTPRIARILLAPTAVEPLQPVTITIDGAGACQGYTLDYGDGNSEPRSATLPDHAQHVYRVAGRYVITAVATGSCTGTARTPLDVRGRKQR